MRFRLDHVADARLRAEYGVDSSGLFIEVFLADEVEPTVRFADDVDGWDQRPPLFWQAADVLVTLGFFTVAELNDAMGVIERGVPPPRMPRRLRVVAELVENLREACESA